MFPPRTAKYVADCCLTHSEFGSQRSVRDTAQCITGADVLHLGLSKLCVAVASTLRSSRLTPTLCSHIHHVITVGSDEKVSRVDTRTDIAGVANKHSRRDRAVHRFIRVAMRHDISAVGAENAVTLSSGSSPEPARGGLIDLTPKAGFGWYTSHVKSPVVRFGRTGDVSASPGLFMPNYNTLAL